MSPLETVKAFYAALGTGDVPAALAHLHEEISWTENEGFPYYSGTWTKPQEVLEKLLIPASQDWDGFSVQPDSFLTEANEVVAFGIYGGKGRASGKTMAAPFAHRWGVRDGHIASFMQYTDTVLVQAALRG